MNVFVLAGLVEPALPVGAPDSLGAARALLATVAVLALLGLLAWLLRRGTLVLPGRHARSAVVIETAVPLGERRSLVIVAVEGRRLLLGMTPSHVALVTELAASAQTFGNAVDRRLDPPAGGAR